MAKSQIQQLSIIQELELSIETIKMALSIIQKIKPQKTPYFAIFLLLSTGIERLLKVVIGMRLLSNGSDFPTEKELKKDYGHDLIKLKSKFISTCYNKNLSVPIIVKEDQDFLERDLLLNRLLLHLSEFAQKDRYVYMNRISNEASTGEWLSRRWADLENTIIPINEAVKFIEEDQINEYKSKISKSLVIVIEKFLGCLCRSITLGKMDQDARSAGMLLFDFLFIRESELGNRSYELFGFSKS